MIALDIVLADSRSLTLPENLAATLSASSQARLTHISTDLRRRQFLLGRWLMAQAAERTLANIEEGSDYPVFAGEPERHASISHSGPHVAVIVSQGMRCGLDIEYPVRQRNWLSLAERAFSASEAAWIHDAEAELQTERFHRIWTLREAAFKAGLLDSVVGKESVFDPVQERHIANWHWQYLQHAGIHISVVGKQAFEASVREIRTMAPR